MGVHFTAKERDLLKQCERKCERTGKLNQQLEITRFMNVYEIKNTVKD